MFKEENHTRTPCRPGVIFLKYWVKLFLKTLQKVNLLAQNAQNAQSKVLIRSLSNLQDCTEPSRLSPPRLIPKPKHSSLFQNPTTCGRMISLSVQTLHFLQVTLFASLILPQTSFGVHYWEVTAKGRWWTFFKKEFFVQILKPTGHLLTATHFGKYLPSGKPSASEWVLTNWWNSRLLGSTWQPPCVSLCFSFIADISFGRLQAPTHINESFLQIENITTDERGDWRFGEGNCYCHYLTTGRGPHTVAMDGGMREG